MQDAKQQGHATLLLRRRLPASTIYPYDIVVSRAENEGFGFIVISSSTLQRGTSIGKVKLQSCIHH